ncbi:uncharacterized protein [Maniola hyperantus]|uniref:uncharacterized protein n=1 Tax=Aphantopus hyperantus TaxID=2795564 RepID=UPI0037496E12
MGRLHTLAPMAPTFISGRRKNDRKLFYRKERFWRTSCRRDFPDIYVTAYRKRKLGLSWRNLYRSLSLWSKLHTATETFDESASVSPLRGEICDFHILKGGEIGIQTERAITYYDINTLKQSDRNIISGYYYSYVENDNVILVNNTASHLHVIRKVLRTPLQEDTILPSVKTFLLNNDKVYYATMNNEIYMCDLLQERIESNLLGQTEYVICFGYKNGLHILTCERNIYTLIGTEIIFQRKLDEASNLMHMLNQYNFLENLEWRAYYVWIFKLDHHIPRGGLRDIIFVKVYGDIVFVGTLSGEFRIYRSPYLNNELDLFNTKPVKQYDFSNNDLPEHRDMSAVFKVDVIEGEDSHTVLVGMRDMLAVLNFSHNFGSGENRN